MKRVLLASLFLVGATARADRGPFQVFIPDNSGYVAEAIARWNAAHPDERAMPIIATAFQFSPENSEHLLEESRGWCVGQIDVIHVGDLASAGALAPIDESDYDLAALFPVTVAAARWRGTLFAVPWRTDTGLFYYRTDLLAEAGLAPPRTWAEMESACQIIQQHHAIACYAAQLDPYEGLTCNVAEAIGSAGDRILNDDGTLALGAGAVTGVGELVDAVAQGYTTADGNEGSTFQSFVAGDVLFARNWPFMYFIAANTGECGDECGPPSAVVGKFDVSPVLGETGSGSGVLGGQHLAINASCKQRETARDFIRFLIGRDEQRELGFTSASPVRRDVYHDADEIAANPWYPVLEDALLAAVYRPVTPNYLEVSRAVYEETAAALRGDQSAAAAVDAMRARISALLVQ